MQRLEALPASTSQHKALLFPSISRITVLLGLSHLAARPHPVRHQSAIGPAWALRPAMTTRCFTSRAKYQVRVQYSVQYSQLSL